MVTLKSKNWSLNNVETVLFDKDGTFIDLHYFWGKMTELRVLEIINRFNISKMYFDKLCLCLGYDTTSCKMLPDGITALYSRVKIIEIFRVKLIDFGVSVTDVELTEIFDYVNTIFYKEMMQYTKPIQSAITFIKELKNAGVQIGIVTSDSVESTNLTLEQFGWEDLFDVVIGRESCLETKESGKPTRLAMNKLGAKSETTIMIGDAPMDYISAKNAGIDRTVLVSTGQIKIEELQNVCEYVLGNLNEFEILSNC